MTTESNRPQYAKMKSWADHCSSDEESDAGMHHPARLAPGDSMDPDLSYDESIEHISVTGEDDVSLDNLVGNGNGRDHGGRDGNRHHQNNNNNNRQQSEEIPYPEEIDFENKPPNFPTQAPYTAHIRNLCYKIEDAADLADKIEGLTRWRYQKKQSVTVTNARVGIDRATGKRKGFGYIEFDTPEELMIFLNLNDGFSRLNGRILSIDIAKNSRGGPRNNNNNRNNNRDQNHYGSHGHPTRSKSGGISNIDGSQFRGGRYNNRASSNNSSIGAGPGGDGGGASAPPTERRSLKLAPRTKPVEAKEWSGSNSRIFGAAKARDETSWRQKKTEESAPAPVTSHKEKEDNTTNGNSGAAPPSNDNSVTSTGTVTHGERGDRNSFGRGSGRGRGGRGDNKRNSSRGRGGRAGGRGRRDSNNRKNNDRRNSSAQNGKEADGWDEAKGGPSAQPPVTLPTVEKNETKKVTKISNAFAALGFDSDSE